MLDSITMGTLQIVNVLAMIIGDFTELSSMLVLSITKSTIMFSFQISKTVTMILPELVD